MSDRIRELAEQADEFAVEADDRDQKFAKLIVAEAITVLQKRFMCDSREDMEVRRCIADVKNHFGVKE
jgi:hypothetical protein